MTNGVRLGLLAASLLTLAGCKDSVPAGQVAATVNGEEVTIQEINSEIQAANLAQNIDKKAAQKAALQRVIDRKLVIAAAEEKGVDKTPDFLSQKRRAEEMMLAQAYARQQLSAVPVPSDADITRFITERPSVFSNREQLTLDQIRFAPPRDLQSLRVLDNDHTLDAVAAHLTQLGIKYQRSPAGLDTASAPPQLIQAIEKLPAGEPFVVPSQGLITVSVITGRRPIPTDQAQARSAAVQAWRQQRFGEILQQQITQLRNNAKITYQNDFAPDPKGAKPVAPAAR